MVDLRKGKEFVPDPVQLFSQINKSFINISSYKSLHLLRFKDKHPCKQIESHGVLTCIGCSLSSLAALILFNYKVAWIPASDFFIAYLSIIHYTFQEMFTKKYDRNSSIMCFQHFQGKIPNQIKIFSFIRKNLFIQDVILPQTT